VETVHISGKTELTVVVCMCVCGVCVCVCVCVCHSLANCDSCLTPAKSEAIEYLQVGSTEIRYSIAWTMCVYL